MLEIIVIIGFMIIAVLIFAGGLQFSQYKKKKNAGCCGDGSCGSDSHSCYSSKVDFVDNFESIKAKRAKL